MDPATLAAATLSVLAPYLVKAGGGMAEAVGASLPEHARKLWAGLAEKLHGKPAAETAVQDLVTDPADEDTRAAFRKELKKALSEDPEFLAALGALLAQAQQEAIRNSAVAGDNSTAVNVGGNVQGNIVIGNQNTVNSPPKKK